MLIVNGNVTEIVTLVTSFTLDHIVGVLSWFVSGFAVFCPTSESSAWALHAETYT